MAATRTERDEDFAGGDEPSAWDERPIFGESRGLPWWGAILLALLVSALGAAVDLKLNDKTTLLFQATYFIACVAAVCWVGRRNLFGPMVQPPLILAAVLIGLELMENGLPKNLELKEFLLSYGIPVINGFPTMAITTGVTLAVGLFRLFWQRDPDGADAADDDGPLVPAAKTTVGAKPAGARATRPPTSPARADRTQMTPPPGAPQRRPSAATNRVRPLEDGPPQRDSAPRVRPRGTETGARSRVQGTLSPRPNPANPPSRRQVPPARPWESDPPSIPPSTGRRRRLPPQAGEQPPRTTGQPHRTSGELPRTRRHAAPEPPPGGAAEPPPRRTTGRRPPPQPRSRRWDPDDRS